MSVKIHTAVSALLTLGMIGTGCGNYTVNSDYTYSSASYEAAPANEIFTDNISASDDNSEKSAENTEISDLAIAEMCRFDFLNALKSHNTELLMQYGGARSVSAYDFLNGVYLSDWKIVDTIIYNDLYGEDNKNDCTFKVELDIEKSDCDLFPVGKSIWELDYSGTDDDYFALFRPENTKRDGYLSLYTIDSITSNAVKMCYSFTSEFDWLCQDTNYQLNFDGITGTFENELFVNNLISFSYINDKRLKLDSSCRVSVDNLKSCAKNLLGIENYDFSTLPAYNAEDNSLDFTQNSFFCGYGILTEETIIDDTHTIVIDWYADNIYLAKASTIKYTLTPNGNDTLRLVSLEKTFDTGERLAFSTDYICE